MKKRLSYTACKDGHYVVMCGKTALGCIEPKGELFKKRIVFQEDVLDGAEWTGECLIELGEHMLSLENKVSRKPAHNTRSTKNLQHAMVKDFRQILRACA
jgi:hypothetical protein